MWYVSCEGWLHADLPRYNIKLATSLDGLEWKQNGTVCLDLDENETALARYVLLKNTVFIECGYHTKQSHKTIVWVMQSQVTALNETCRRWVV